MRRKQIFIIIFYFRNLDYQASSPDEKALVEACAKLGFVFTGDDNDTLNVTHKSQNVLKKPDTDEQVVQYKRLQVLEFTSDRKRMSVIIRNRLGEIWLYTKGAESHVLPLCTNTESQLTNTTQHHINEFAKQGLRTLAVARRRLTQAEFAHFNNGES
jgi:phospholipid-translocating ATPase